MGRISSAQGHIGCPGNIIDQTPAGAHNNVHSFTYIRKQIFFVGLLLDVNHQEIKNKCGNIGKAKVVKDGSDARAALKQFRSVPHPEIVIDHHGKRDEEKKGDILSECSE